MQLPPKNYANNFLTFVVLLFCFTNWTTAQINWQQTNGPYGGNVNSFAVTGTNLFAGTFGDGVYLSTNNGSSWSAVNTGLTNLNVQTLAVNGTNLFAGTRNGGIFLSTDNGTNWSASNTGLTTTNIWCLTASATNLFAATDAGVFISSDNGTSWTSMSVGLTSMNVYALAVSGTNLYAGAIGGVFLSTNNGTSWTPVSNGLTNTNILALAVSGTNLFAGTESGGVFRSTNNGSSWTSVNNGLTDLDIFSIAICTNGAGGENIFAGSWDDGIFLSTNNGANWTAVNTGLIITSINKLAVIPNGAGGTNLFAGTRGNGIFLSTNGGTNWTAASTGLARTWIHSLIVSGTNLFAGNYNGGGVFLSTNNGTSWTSVCTGLPNGGVSSLAAFPNGAGGTNLFAAIFNKGVFLSTNNGTSWTAASTGLPTINISVMEFAKSGTSLFAGDGGGGVFLSTNNGTSWNEVNTGLTNKTVKALVLSGTNLFAGTNGGGVFLSTNNGASWTAVNAGLTNTDVYTLTISPNGAGGNNIFAGTIGGGVFLSTNNGTSWTAANTGLTYPGVQTFAVSGSNIFAGNDAGVFLSTNNGTSWTSANTGLTNPYVFALAVLPDMSGTGTTKLFAGTDGGGVFVSAIPMTLPPPTIVSFSPPSGHINTMVTITGTNFSAIAASNIVYFGAVKATVTAATSTSLSVIVPSGATYQPITVTNMTTGLTAFSSKPFTVTFPSSQIIGAATFESKVDFITGSYPNGIAMSDIDGDGKPDLVVTNYDNSVSVFRNTSASGSIAGNSFAPKVNFTTRSSPWNVVIGDVDGDGRPDVVFTNPISNTVSVFRNTSTSGSINASSFASELDFTTGLDPLSVAIGDVDGDGKPDLVIANNGSNTVSVLRNTCTSGSITANSFAPKVDFMTTSFPTGIAIGDVDGDGKPDLVITNNGSNTVSVLRNTCTSGSITANSFAPKVDFTTGSAPTCVAVGDVDGDGKQDLVVANERGNTVSVFRNTCTSGFITISSFAPKIDFPMISEPHCVSIGDIDGDGKPDLVVSDLLSNTVSVLRNTSTSGSVTTSSFAPKVDFTTGWVSWSVAIGDVDGDGKPDLITANYNDSSISVLRNMIGGTSSQTTFQKTYGGAADEDIGNLLEAPDGGYVTVGNTKSCTQTVADLCIFKTDKSGNLQWAKSYGDNGTGNVNIASTENGYIIAGTVQVPGNGNDILVTRTDTVGNVLWKKTFGGTHDDYGNAIYRMKNGEYVVLGYTLNYGAGGWDAFAMRITGNGDVVWFKTYGTNATDLVNRLVEESDGSLVMTGTTYISGTHNMMLLKTDSGGNLLWAKQYDYTGDESGYGIARASNGDYLIVTCAYTNSINANVLLYRTTPEGVFRWAKLYRDSHFPGKTYFAGFDVAALPDGNILLTGEWAGALQESQCDGLFLKVDSVGSILSGKTFGGSGTDFFRKILLTSDGGYLLGGKTNSQGNGGYDFFLVKTDADGISGTSTNIFPDYATPVINESSVSLSTSAYTLAGQSSQFSRSGTACWNSLPLTVVSVTPQQNALNIAQNTKITVMFSSNMDSSTFTNSTVKINGSLSGLHPSTFSYNSGTRTLLITPTISFKLGECVTVTVTRGIKNITNEPITRSYSWNFTVKTNTSSCLYQWKSTVNVGTNPFYLAAGDFDKNGSMDLAVVNNFDNSVSILKNNGSGSFTLSSTIPVGNRPGSITAADLDGDGFMDLALTNSGSGTVSILKNKKDGTFAQTSLASGGSAPWEVIAVDVNGDGALDLAVTNYSSNNVTILMNNGSGVFILSSTISVGTSPYSLTASDWDGDGIMDLAVTNYGSNSLSILINNGNGIFTPTTFSAGSGPVSASAMDVNADGRIDLAVSNNNSNAISVLENNGNGTLTQTTTVAVGNHPAFKAPVDIDGDGDLDLVVPSADSISLLQNNGSGTFTQKTLFGTGIGSNYRMIIAADLDGDGIIELAGVNNGSNSVSVFKVRSQNATVRLSTSSLAFGSIATGARKNLYLKIYNDGTDSSLVINNIVSSNPSFTINKTYLIIPALGNDSILVTFSPATNGTTFFDSLTISSTAFGNSNVYVALRGSSTFKSPRVVFSTNVGGPVYAGISIISDNALYAIASGDAIYRMNTIGSIAYSLQVAGDIRSASSIAYDNTVYIASSDRNLYAFSKDGNSAWPPLPTGGVLTATPVIDSAANRLYIGVSNHNFIAVNRSTGTVAWNYFADDQIKNSAVITGDRKLIFATQKGSLYGFNLKKLSVPAAPTWQLALPDTAPSSFAVDNKGNIYFGTGSGILFKVALPDNKQPEIVWQTLLGHSIVGAPVIDAHGILYVGSTDSKLYAVDISSGAVKWSFATSGPIQSTPAISNAGKIFVANDSGEVYCLDSAKVIQWYYKSNAAIVSHLLYYKSILFFGTLGNKVIALYDSSQSSALSKSSGTVENFGEPVWSTFQGDGQRTGASSASPVTGLGINNEGIPSDFALMQNYPNPFNPSTVIAYELPKSGKVSIKVFNMLGQQIDLLVDGFQSAGYHEVTFDTKSIPSGIYFYQMTVGSFIQTKKMVFMK